MSNTLALDSLPLPSGLFPILVASRSTLQTRYYMADSAEKKSEKRSKEKAEVSEKPAAEKPADGDGNPCHSAFRQVIGRSRGRGFRGQKTREEEKT